MNAENLIFPVDLPQTDTPKKKEKVNCLQEILAEIMSERKVEAAEIQKATGIPWGTLHGWITGDVSAQKADKNLLRLAQFFNVPLEYLCFGIGSDEAPFDKFEN